MTFSESTMLSFKKPNINQGLMSLYLTRLICKTTAALVGLFIPIYLYLLTGKVEWVLVYFIVGHLLYGFYVALGAMLMNKIGIRRSFRITIWLGGLYYLLYYWLDKTSVNAVFEPHFTNPIFFLLCLTLVIITIHRAMYWVPMHTDMAKFTDKNCRGKEVGITQSILLFSGALGPVLAGYILKIWNYDVLFFIAILLYLSALFPLIFLPRTHEKYSWGYFETWKHFFSPRRRHAVVAFMAMGAEDVVGIVIWPIFIYGLLNGNYFEIGALSSLVVVVTIILQLTVGNLADKGSKRKMLRWGSGVYSIFWVFKIFIATAFQIFIVSTLHNLSKIFLLTPFDALTYEKAADQGHYVDEFTVIHEMAVQFGKVIMLLFVLGLLQFFSLTAAFVLAAVASLFTNFLADHKHVEGRHIG